MARCSSPAHLEAFASYLARRGIRRLCLTRRRFPNLSLAQDAFLQVMVWGYCLEQPARRGCSISECHSYSEGSICFGRIGGRDTADAVITYRACSTRRELFDELKDYKPLIAIDLGLIGIHRGRETKSLRVQVGASLGVIRRYLWDRHLLLAGLEPGVAEWLRAFTGRALVDYSWLPGDEAAMLRGASRIIVLDPSADSVLTGEDVLTADAFIIGGIVDITPRPGATRLLRLRGLGEHRRIVLRGSIHGVPSRLPQVVEIILRSRLATCGDVEEAVRQTMSPRDARYRAYIELMKWSRGRRAKATLELYYELKTWLPLSLRDFIRAARMAGLDVSELVKEAQQRPNSSQRGRR